jgi:hypothetical protein
MINVLEHTDDLSALQEAYRVCRKNVVFSVPHEKEEELGHYNITYHPYVDPTHLRYYTMERVTATFADAGFTMDEICFDGPINSLGLFLRALHLPRLLSIGVGITVNRIPGIKKYYMNIEGVASRDATFRVSLNPNFEK